MAESWQRWITGCINRPRCWGNRSAKGGSTVGGASGENDLKAAV